ncbi:MAG: NUDIX domain-containing protein [Planctomycetota bacterium]|jgi:8-oxo-dGTP pyrophosphatase MutT (NUDIX family)|nr:NUDIX domain-containing protein [Planctomycetota bacterium]
MSTDFNQHDANRQPQRDRGRHAVVGIIYEEGQFLVIRRSQFVSAPGLICFPGGGIELGEDFETAVKRELVEELDLRVEVRGHLWTSQTRWGTRLEWLHCERCEGSEPSPNLQEVEEYLWMRVALLEGRGDLLGSMPEFLASFRNGSFRDHFTTD